MNELHDDDGIRFSGLSLEGFKSISDNINLEILPITVFAGANSSGKSSVFQPILLLKQTLEASYDPGALLLNGPIVRYTSSKQFLSKPINSSQKKAFKVGIQMTSGDGGQTKLVCEFKSKRSNRYVIEIVAMEHWRNEELESRLRLGMSARALRSALPEGFRLFAKNFSKFQPGTKPAFQLYRNRCFLQVTLRSTEDSTSWVTGYSPSDQYADLLRKLIHVPGLRGNPERSYKTTAVGNQFPGTFESYVASIILGWEKSKDPRLDALSASLVQLGLTERIKAKQLDETQVELQVSQKHSSNMINVADVGLGVSQVLPVLVALLSAEASQVVYIEQPEIHLHPRAQVALANIMVAASNNGARIVVETHSSLFITALQTSIAKGEIDKSRVALHWFEINDQGGSTVNTAEIDEFGAFGNWPEDFSEISLDTDSKYIDAVEENMTRSFD